MSAFRLQTFSPRLEQAREPAPAPLPSSPALTEEDLAQAREEGYAQGFLDAQAEATASLLADDTRLSAEFVEALSDARLTNEAARRHVMAGLAPMVEAVCRAIAPALAEAGLAAEIAARVERAFLAAPDAVPRLRCAPEIVERVAAVFAERELAAVIEAAPELLRREAELSWDDGYDRIDLDACVAEVAACLASHLTPRANAAPQGDDRHE
jgi:flagellar biosynthesis/type III secretory pathway protein FliH